MTTSLPPTPTAERRRGPVRRMLRWLLSLKGSPQQISLGLAVGVLVGFSPLWGLHMVIAAALATLVGGSRPAAVAAVWLSNPLTVIPLYTLTYRVGHAFVPGASSASIADLLRRVIFAPGVAWWDVMQRSKIIFRVGEEILIPLTIGGLLIGTFAAVSSYVICRVTLTRLRQRKRHKKPAADQP